MRRQERPGPQVWARPGRSARVSDDTLFVDGAPLVQTPYLFLASFDRSQQAPGCRVGAEALTACRCRAYRVAMSDKQREVTVKNPPTDLTLNQSAVLQSGDHLVIHMGDSQTGKSFMVLTPSSSGVKIIQFEAPYRGEPAVLKAQQYFKYDVKPAE